MFHSDLVVKTFLAASACIAVMTVFPQPAPVAPRVQPTPLSLQIQCIVPSLHRIALNGYDIIVARDEFAIMSGLDGCRIKGECCRVTMIIKNDNSTSYLLSEWYIRGIILHDVEYKDAQGVRWILNDHIKHIADMDVVYNVPVLAKSEKRLTLLIDGCDLALAQDAVRGNPGAAEPVLLDYDIRKRVRIDARPIAQRRLGDAELLSVWGGNGRCDVNYVVCR